MAVFPSAPLLSPFRVKGGTFYTLSSAVRDMSLLFSNDNIKIAFSKFACLRLPHWENVTSQSIFYDGTLLQPAVTDPNTVLPKAFIQNYIENLIQYSQGSRTDNTYKNYAEAAFFKAMRSANYGGTVPDPNAQPMQFDPQTEVVFDEHSGQNVNVYKELNDVSYEKVVKYVGDVNLINHVKSDGNEYTEVYVHVPNNAGYQDEILFYPNTYVTHDAAQIPIDGGDPDAVVGLSDFKGVGQVEPVYDTNDFKYDVNGDDDKAGIWFTDLENDETKWNKGDFEFNVVLLYYDIYDKDDDTTLQRNLFGILYLDRFVVSGGGFEINELIKYQPDEIQPGNAFGFRFNLKFSNSTNQVTSEITINDYNTISMELYMEALARLQVVTDKYLELEKIILEIQQEQNALNAGILTDQQTVIDASTLIVNLDERVQSLESASTNSADVRISNEDLFKLFQQTVNAINTEEPDITINITMTAKALLPETLLDKDNLIFEDSEGNLYQYDDVNNVWVLLN